MDILIKTIDLTYSYRFRTGKAITALDRVNMTLSRGEILAITGQNGSGKSTLARHFNALLIPQEGSVTVNGLSTADKNNISAIRKTVGMVFQNPDNQLVSSIVEEDIAFGPENLGLPQAEIRERVDWALAILNLEDLRSEPPHNLSTGEKQRVAIAGVLAMKPDCIVLDEPTAHLDPRSRREVMESVLKLNREEGITMVLLTHYMNEVINCDRMLVMDQGRVMLEGSPREIFSREKELTEMGLGFPAARRLAVALHREGIEISPHLMHTEELIDSLCRLR